MFHALLESHVTRISPLVRRAVALGLAACWLFVAGAALAAQDAQKPAEKKETKDPVCGMKLDPATSKLKVEYKGKTYYFCSDTCKTKFEKEPAKYAEPSTPKK